MSADLILGTRRDHAKTLLDDAVTRHRLLSLEGALERLFALAFRGLVYPQIWEDPAVDMKAMAIEPHHHIVTISSGGCNALSYLTANPAKVTAVDLSPAHVALVNLKLAGLRHLPDWTSFYRFFGEANAPSNLHDYAEFLRDELDGETRKYWESRLPTGQMRLSRFANNLYAKGALGKFIGLGHVFARLAGVRLGDYLHCKTLVEQRRFFESEIAPIFENRTVRYLCSHRIALFGLGIPPSQYEALSGGENMAVVLKGRLEKLACCFALADNYFAWQAFGRSYAPGGKGPVPPYLAADNFTSLKARADRVVMLHASLTETLSRQPAGSVDRFVLLDAQDWMTDRQLNALWSAIAHAARPNARVIFRTAGQATILPGRVEAALLGSWDYLEQESQALTREDRSAIYGGFHVYQRRH